MVKFGKDIFGKGFDIKAEVTNGQCPVCESSTIFVSLYKNFLYLQAVPTFFLHRSELSIMSII